MNASRVVRLLRATEDVDNDAEWLSATLDILAPELDDGLGVAAMRFDVGDVRRIRVEDPVGVGLPPGLGAAQMLTATMQSTPEYVQATYRAFDCITASEVGPACEGAFLAKTFDHGLRDTFCLAAIMPSDVGCAVFAGRKKRTLVGRRARDRWRVVTQELRRILLHRTEVATQARARLARRARSHACIDELAATPGWERLEAEGWRPVRGYTSGARPFVVLTRGSGDPVARLTPREREAALLAVQGLPNKLIGYELGISASTVGVLLWRATGKLGVKTRAQLAAALTASTQVGPEADQVSGDRAPRDG